MALLTVALQEGFEDEPVVVRVNGKEVFEKKNVKTRLQIGLADSFDVDVTSGPATVEIILPRKNLTKKIEAQVSEAVYIGVSIVAGEIKHRVSDAPFGYV